MLKLKYSVAIPVKDYTDALKKVQKFVKRGFVDDVAWNNSKGFRRNCSYVVVHKTVKSVYSAIKVVVQVLS